MLSEYLKLTRFFNMGLTGIAPVLGAVSMWNINHISLEGITILFLIGCLSHIFGFVLNDVIDIRIDKLSNELTTRPIVSGRITRKKAFYFAIFCMILSFLLSIFFYNGLDDFLILLLFLIIAYILATIYNIIGKKYPGMDCFVAGAVFFLILFGASTIGTPTSLAWVVSLIGGTQVLFMNMINGSIKDIDHDSRGRVKTLATKLGARTIKGRIILPSLLKGIGYLIESWRVILLFIPFMFLSHPYYVWQIGLLCIIIALTFYSIYRLFTIQFFDRKKIRKSIGIIVILMYTTAPIMLSSFTTYILLIAFIPPLWFILSNMVLHKTILEAKTM
jgi:4-hydroxybenzoate polyprenyltransferase